MLWDNEEKLQTAGLLQTTGQMSIRNRAIVPNLKAQRDELMKRVQKIDELLSLLDVHPEFETLFNLTRELI